MKRLSKIIFLLICVSATASLEAGPGRGGRGGMGGGPGGGFRPSPGGGGGNRGGMNRPPRPSGPSVGQRPIQQPGRPGNGNGNIGNRPIGNGPGPIRPHPSQPISRPGGRPNAGDIAGAIGRNPPGHMPGNPGNRPGYPGYHKSEMTQSIHNHFHYHPGVGYPFGRGWCDHNHWHYHNWPYWTAAATGAALTAFVNYAPYGGYGSSEQVVYYPVQPAPQEVYDENIDSVSQVAEQAQSVPVADDAQLLNIGAFGIIPYGQKDMTLAIQLTTANDGSLRGMQWDLVKNTTAEVVGSIEQDTLKVVWQLKDQPDSPYFETNVDQITQQESLVNVFDPKTQSMVSWQLIQIDAKDLPPQN